MKIVKIQYIKNLRTILWIIFQKNNFSILVPKEGSISLLVNNNSFKDKIIDNFESNK